MAKKKKRKYDEIAKDVTPVIGFGLAGTTSSVLGGGFQSKLPAGTTNPLTTTGRVVGSFTGPVATIAATNITMKQLKKIKPKKKRRR